MIDITKIAKNKKQKKMLTKPNLMEEGQTCCIDLLKEKRVKALQLNKRR